MPLCEGVAPRTWPLLSRQHRPGLQLDSGKLASQGNHGGADTSSLLLGQNAGFLFNTRLVCLIFFPFSPQRLIQNRGSMRNLHQSSKHVQNGQKVEWYVISAGAPSWVFLLSPLSYQSHRPGERFALQPAFFKHRLHTRNPSACHLVVLSPLGDFITWVPRLWRQDSELGSSRSVSPSAQQWGSDSPEPVGPQYGSVGTGPRR